MTDNHEVAWDVRAGEDGRFYGYVTVSHSARRGAVSSTVTRCPQARNTLEEAEADARALAADMRSRQAE